MVRARTGRTGSPGGGRAAAFSLVELMVTVLLAGIVFAAIIPFFVNALRTTSGDEYRVNSSNIAQDRIEQIHLLDYADIDEAKLNATPADSSFGDGRFGHDYILVGESRPYHVAYEVTSMSNEPPPQKYVKVSVSREGESYVTTAETIIKNPEPGDMSVTDAEPTDLTLTVWFDNYKYVTSPGVFIRRVRTDVTPNVTTSPTPVWPPGPLPSAAQPEVTFEGLTGGPNYTYYVFCQSSKATYTLAAPPFRLWTSGRLKFDTYPGGD